MNNYYSAEGGAGNINVIFKIICLCMYLKFLCNYIVLTTVMYASKPFNLFDYYYRMSVAIVKIVLCFTNSVQEFPLDLAL